MRIWWLGVLALFAWVWRWPPWLRWSLVAAGLFGFYATGLVVWAVHAPKGSGRVPLAARALPVAVVVRSVNFGVARSSGGVWYDGKKVAGVLAHPVIFVFMRAGLGRYPSGGRRSKRVNSRRDVVYR